MNNKGFTLIELIMVIILLGILSATAVVMIGNIVTQQRFDETVKEMNELKKAMLGNPELITGGARSSFGYVGDMGGLPPNLTVLVLQAGPPVQPSWVKTSVFDPSIPDLGTGAGWRGPYIDNKKDDAGNYIALRDGWGSSYQYNGSTGQITSYGPDGLLGGGDDIVIPETSITGVVFGGVSGQVRGNQGGAVEGAAVRIYYPNGSGVHTTWDKITNSSGFYNFSSIPIGRRTMRVTSGSLTIADTVVVDGGQTQTKDFVIADTIPPNPPTNLAAARASYTSLSLNWSASTSPDTASYKIYRGTAPGGEVLYKTNITGISYIDDNNGAGLAAGITYYYRMSAVDTAGNESTLAAEVNETVKPIQQVGLATVSTPGFLGWPFAAGTCPTTPTNNRKQVDLTIRNNDLSTITVTQVGVTWSGGGTLRRIESPAGTNRYSNASGNPSPASITLTSPIPLSSGTNQSMRLFFCIPGGANPTAINLDFNPTTFDGQFLIAF